MPVAKTYYKCSAVITDRVMQCRKEQITEDRNAHAHGGVTGNLSVAQMTCSGKS